MTARSMLVTVAQRPKVIEEGYCTWCNREGVRAIEFDPGCYDNCPSLICTDCLHLAIDTMRETPCPR